MLPTGFEPTIQASERPQIHALDHAATGIGTHGLYRQFIIYIHSYYKKVIKSQLFQNEISRRFFFLESMYLKWWLIINVSAVKLKYYFLFITFRFCTVLERAH